ncbi:MAG: DUF3179 domain-containing protein [Gemmatimonadetes bacterium]|nr:DUF3179 domain-containing protein [Gemmatimonadota bacterium]
MIDRAACVTLGLALTVGAARAPAQSTEWRTDFSRATVPLEEIVSGGPPKDGIAALDEPRFESVARADRWLQDPEPVMVVAMDDDVRAYPLQILIWHEIVNDVVGSRPVAVTYCPLCNTAMTFDRTVNGVVLDFGTTGRLRHSDLVMYDRQTESWWQQATGEAIVGVHAGQRLPLLATPLMSWRDFRRTYPEALVLSRDTGHSRPYGRNPYSRYDGRRTPFERFFRRSVDPRLPAMERVAAVESSGGAVGYTFSLLAQQRVVNDTLAGQPIVVFWTPGVASALDAAELAGGRDVGATGAFDRRVDGRVLSFEAVGDGRFRDRETQSEWDATGRALAGPLALRRLVPLPHTNPFWFVWAVFRPDARLVR